MLLGKDILWPQRTLGELEEIMHSVNSLRTYSFSTFYSLLFCSYLGPKIKKQTGQNNLTNHWAAKIRPGLCSASQIAALNLHCLTAHFAIRHLEQQALLWKLCSITGNGMRSSHTGGSLPQSSKYPADMLQRLFANIFRMFSDSSRG